LDAPTPHPEEGTPKEAPGTLDDEDLPEPRPWEKASAETCKTPALTETFPTADSAASETDSLFTDEELPDVAPPEPEVEPPEPEVEDESADCPAAIPAEPKTRLARIHAAAYVGRISNCSFLCCTVDYCP
jgi:hypothetical protein